MLRAWQGHEAGYTAVWRKAQPLHAHTQTLWFRVPAGTPVPDHPRVAVMADGSAKPAKYSYTSTVQNLEGFPPWSGSYLGCTAHGVLHRFSTGDLASEAQQRYACRAAGDDGDDAGGDSAVACSSNLTCSRASASARGVVDIAGVAGVVCAHGVPLLNCFVPMPTPEQHAYHVANLVEAVQRRPDIRDIYIDIGCRVNGTLRAAFEELTQQEPPLLLPANLEKVGCRICVSLDRQLRLPSILLTLQINIWVPWMHGFDHDLPCQLKNSGLYQVRELTPRAGLPLQGTPDFPACRTLGLCIAK